MSRRQNSLSKKAEKIETGELQKGNEKIIDEPLFANQQKTTKKTIKKKSVNQDQEEDKEEYVPSLGRSSTLKKVKKNSKIPDNEIDQMTPPKQSTKNKKQDPSNELTIKASTPIKSNSSRINDHENVSPDTIKKGRNRQKSQKAQDKSALSKENDEEIFIDIQKHEDKVIDYDDFDDPIPTWARKENAKDANGKRSDHPEYDPTTLYIPPNALDSVTPTMKQYWQLKSENYDKIILFKVGKFYELFYEDALICHKELDLNWMGNKLHTGFPEKALDKFAYILVNKGYKVCVVEQTETPKQMEERLKSQKFGKKEKIVKREMVQVMSKGTYIDPNDLNFEAKILLSVRLRKNLFSVAFLEIGSAIITVGAFPDDDNFTLLKSFITQIRPVEVIYETNETSPNLLRILKNCPSRPVLSPVNDPKAWNGSVALSALEKYYGLLSNWPEILQEVLQMVDYLKQQILVSLSGMITYLTKMLIVENILCTARYEIYNPVKSKLTRMMMDSQALQHLEVLEADYSIKNPFEGSLLSYIDKTVSPFGKRLLRKWICAPLLEINQINERLDAIEDLDRFHEDRDQFMRELKFLPDIERLCAKVYSQSIKKNDSVVLFEDVSLVRLKEFKRLLENLAKARGILNNFLNKKFKSALLKNLTSFVDFHSILEKKSSGVPEIISLLKEMSDFIQWEGPKQDIPLPKSGIDRDYDSCKKEIDKIESEFTEYLIKIKERFGGNKEICYAHTKHRYEIEIPSKLVEGSKKPKDFEFSSKKQDRERFITPYIKKLVEKLEEAEERLKQTRNIFVCFLFNYFHKHYSVWDRFVEALAQLDCLCSLSVTSFTADGIMCRPELFPLNQKVFLEIKDMRHPCLSLKRTNFVPNDIVLGDYREDVQSQNIMILTGPNMGGKSTILRQACIAAILAQIGCYVPASSCRLSVVDRIFTRIGASDRLSEGKSTFFVEMEETVNIVKYGSVNSLAIMDELGRGTSTFDGVAIAYSVLKYIMNKLKCRTLFATHYHVLLDEFRDEPQIKFFHMGSEIDLKNERIIFLYKLMEGECSNSFGLNIANISGLGNQIIEVAAKKANEFEENFNIREAVRTNQAFNKVLKGLKLRRINPEECLNIAQTAIQMSLNFQD